ncbi:hypothetical protein FNF27_01760 [Cafeteria roenbergensis]|uniref:Phospholipase B-like n=2 Tax=Cafeteria roenbergensis TaxID=33653 RepID=A0A5A8EIA4_CAFRO|nr:hypothetical protein FNF27_01760 [Cafeteria roenbergensis]
MRAALCFIAAAAAAACAAAAGPTPPASCDGAPNDFPITSPTPKLVRSFGGGSRYSMAGTNISVLHLRGSAFEMGQQYGSLMREEIIQLFPDMYTYIDEQIDNFLEKLPESIRKAIEEYGVPAALQITVDATSPYTPQHWFDLINGMSNTSGVNVTDIHRLILFPELVKAACTNIGAWGAATASGTDLLALRALDFGLDKPLNKFPVLLNFHPTDGGASHSVLSWAGFLGTITGMSSSGMAVTEKVWDAYTELQNIVGYPFHFLMQDILWNDVDTDQALSRVASANRTCAIWLGIADRDNDQFRLLHYSYRRVDVYNPKNFPVYPPYHDRFQDLVFVDKHVQPSHHMCLNELMHQYWGNLDAPGAVQVSAVHGTGDLHAAVYDYANDQMVISVTTFVDGSWRPAHASPWFSMDTKWLWDPSNAGRAL